LKNFLGPEMWFLYRDKALSWGLSTGIKSKFDDEKLIFHFSIGTKSEKSSFSLLISEKVLFLGIFSGAKIPFPGPDYFQTDFKYLLSF